MELLQSSTTPSVCKGIATPWLILALLLSMGQGILGHDPSQLHSRPGHYPYVWCQLTDALLSATDETFYFRPGAGIDVNSECAPLVNIWPITALPDKKAPPKCDEEYEEGHAFTIFYWGGNSNYFHLTKDMTLPLYQFLHHNQDSPPDTVVLMPTVESTRLNKLDWDTPAFQNPSRYWVQIMRPLMKDNAILMPLDRTFLNSSSTVCFKNLYIGTPRVNDQKPEVLQGYVQFMKSQLHVLERPLSIDDLKVGLISRSNRRKVLNEQELINALRPTTHIDLIKFESLSIREQIALVQRYAVIIGVNGAGLMNALFRPEYAVAIQLVPYDAHLNNDEFNKILESTGPVLEWRNKHKSLHRPTRANDERNANSQGDTIVHVAEFKELVEKALDMVRDSLLGIKEEL